MILIVSDIISTKFDKNIHLNVYGETYHFLGTLDKRWYCIRKGKTRKVSGNYVNNMIWLFGDKAQREQERLERQQLFERLQEKRQRLRQQQLEEFII